LRRGIIERQLLTFAEYLARIHVTPITKGTMADYCLKAFKHGRMAYDRQEVWN
jgi:hypothetical protein